MQDPCRSANDWGKSRQAVSKRRENETGFGKKLALTRLQWLGWRSVNPIVLIPITASIQRRDESFRRPLALEDVRGKPLIGWVLEGMRDLLAGARGVLFAALVEHEERFDLTGQIHHLLGRRPDVIVLDREPRGELAAVLKFSGTLEPNQPLLVARGDRVVRSRLHEHLRAFGTNPWNPGVKGLVSVIGHGGEARPVVRIAPGGADVRQIAGREAGVPLIPTGLCYFAKAGEFLEAADAMVKQGASLQAEPVECFGEYLKRGWRVQVSHAEEVWRLAPALRDRLTNSYD